MPFSHIIDNIYLGDIFSSRDVGVLDKVKQVISVCPMEFIYDNHKHCIIDIEDIESEDIISVAKDVYSKLDVPTLIHCHAGRSRSASIIIYYIMKKYNKSYDDAFNFVNTNREIGLNKGFREQFENLDCDTM